VNFTRSGGVGLAVECDDAGALRFCVEDTGPGVPENARASIFEEFEQGEPPATRRKGGTGLGLAIAKRLAAQLGGGLTLAKSSDQGSRFVFALPIPDAAETTPAQPLDGERVLIVAASRFEAPFLARLLNEAGAGAETATSLEVGLARLDGKDADRPTLAIVDCALGPQAAAELAQRARQAGVRRRFLLFSPIERRAFGESALEDFDGWLVKPVRAASLIARLGAATADPAQPTQLAPQPLLAGVAALLAEDNDINALVAMRHLEVLGAAPTRAEDGERAVALAQAALEGQIRRFDVILMDVFMPELDGLEATRRIRALEARAGAPRTPILALTASGSPEDAAAARTAGVDAVLTKPLELADLEAAIRAAIAQPSGEAPQKAAG
jgi:CheY-like chemotaxis protein